MTARLSDSAADLAKPDLEEDNTVGLLPRNGWGPPKQQRLLTRKGALLALGRPTTVSLGFGGGMLTQ